MSEEFKHEQVRSRNEPFAQKTASQIWHETPAVDNPYIAASSHCYGYDLHELMHKRSYVDVIFLLFRGELPSAAQAELLQQLMIALINPGPRHAATRAAMNVGVGKTDPLHILPIATAVYAGEYSGAKEVEMSMTFIEANCERDVAVVVQENFIDTDAVERTGFGVRHGGIELRAVQLAQQLQQLDGAGNALAWGNRLAAALTPMKKNWLITSVAAAVLLDLGFSTRVGASFFQLLGAPGLLAHGLEMAGKPILAMPFVSDENYIVER
ncbi:MAG: hypothetical protein B0W54_00600 [Cellvibrio sp. 79]|nr:MAG: hypothetical protein B0W54_00600 [Cellvibrio sp. 79]